jgi:hypothetical protein
MKPQEFGLLVQLALIVRSLAAPDDQRAIDRALQDMEAASLDETEEQGRSEASTHKQA